MFLAHQCAFFGRIFSSQNLARIFSSGSQNLQKIPGNFLAPFVAHSHLPCLLVNPIPHRRYQCARKLHAADERGLQTLQENHRWVLLRGTFFPLSDCGPVRLFWRNFLFWGSCANFLEWLAELAENSWIFSRSIQTSSLTHTCPAYLLILFHTGDIKVLGNCTQLTSVDFRFCYGITGGCCFEENSFRLRPSAPFLKKFLLSESCSNFLEWLAELGETSWTFLAPFHLLHSLSTHSHLSCLPVNPIPQATSKC